jgi:hypothetical protein
MNARTPIPLRPDFTASRDAAVNALVRAVIKHSQSVLSGYTRRAAVPPLTTGDASAFAQTTAAFLSTPTGYSAGADLLDRGIALQFAGADKISPLR